MFCFKSSALIPVLKICMEAIAFSSMALKYMEMTHRVISSQKVDKTLFDVVLAAAD